MVGANSDSAQWQHDHKNIFTLVANSHYMELISCCINDGIQYMIDFSCWLIAARQGGENASEGNISDIAVTTILRFSNTKGLELALWVDRQIWLETMIGALLQGDWTLRRHPCQATDRAQVFPV